MKHAVTLKMYTQMMKTKHSFYKLGAKKQKTYFFVFSACSSCNGICLVIYTQCRIK